MKNRNGKKKETVAKPSIGTLQPHFECNKTGGKIPLTYIQSKSPSMVQYEK